jgi:hypothetical protein
LDGTIHFWTPCQELVLLYDRIVWLMNISHSMPGVLSTLHSMPGVYSNELCTPCQDFIWTLHSTPRVFLDFALHARSLLFMKNVCSMSGVLMILRNIQISTAVTKLSPICKLTKSESETKSPRFLQISVWLLQAHRLRRTWWLLAHSKVTTILIGRNFTLPLYPLVE